MSYSKTTWANDTTPLSESNMNKIEDELETLDVLTALGVIADTTPQLGGELDINGHSIGGAEYNNGNSGTSKTIDWRIGNHQMVTMNGNCTFAFTAPTKACSLTLKIVNDGTSGRTITLPTISWVEKILPTWTKLASAWDLLSLYYDGSVYIGQASLNCGVPA